MKNYQREYPLFSLCGLNCALCPMHLNQYCPGCGGGEGNQSCAIFRCAREHGCPEYCFQCSEYPCEKYDSVMEYDSFLPHRNMRKDMEQAKSGGIEAYQAELEERAAILQELLDNYNDGRRKTFYMLAVYLLELQDLRDAMEQILRETSGGGTQEKAIGTQGKAEGTQEKGKGTIQGTVKGTIQGMVQEMTLKEKAAAAAGCFQAIAQEKGIVLKLNKKPAKKKTE